MPKWTPACIWYDGIKGSIYDILLTELCFLALCKYIDNFKVGKAKKRKMFESIFEGYELGFLLPHCLDKI